MSNFRSFFSNSLSITNTKGKSCAFLSILRRGLGGGLLAIALMTFTVTQAQIDWSGTINVTSNQTITQNVNIVGDATVNIASGIELIVSGIISGTSSYTLTKSGPGSLILTNNNTYQGPTVINQGEFRLGNTSQNGNIQSPTVVNNGGIGVWRTTDCVIAASISGTGTLYKGNNPTVLTLTGDNTYTGLTTVHGGTLQIGNATSGSIDSDINTLRADNTVRFSRNMTYSKVISGPGSVEINATVRFTGNNTYSGTTTIGTATTYADLYLGNNTPAGHIQYTSSIIINGASDLSLFRTTDFTISAPISGTGRIWKSSETNNKVTLTGVNTYSGATFIGGGTIQVGNGTSGSIANTSQVHVVTQNAVIRFEPGSNMEFSKQITGVGKLEYSGVIGSKELYLTADNDFTGTTTIFAGKLDLSTATGSVGGDIIVNNGAIINFNRSADLIYSKVISGAGSLYKEGSGKLTLTGKNTYSGDTRISSVLTLSSSGSIENSNISFHHNNGKLDVSSSAKKIKGFGVSTAPGEIIIGSSTLTIGTDGETDGGGTFGGVFTRTGTGTGGVIKTGKGTLTLTNPNNTAAGTFTIKQGTVEFGGNWSGNFYHNSGTVLTVLGNLNIGGGLTLAGGEINMNLNAAVPSKITVSGGVQALGIMNNKLNISAKEETDYVLIAASAGITGTNPYKLNLPQLLSGSLSVNSPTQLLLNTIFVPFCDNPAEKVIGNGTEAFAHAPVSTQQYSYTQQIYLAEEIGITDGFITSIAFQYNSATQIVKPEQIIYMANTNKNEFSSGSDWLPIERFTKVFEGSITFNNSGQNNWFKIILDEPFEYAGENIIVACLNNSNTSAGNTPWLLTLKENRCLYAYSNVSQFNPALPPPDGTINTAVPNFKFEYCPNPCEGIIAGTGSGTSYTMPINTYFNYSYVQHLYDASELAGFENKEITSVAFEYFHSMEQTKNNVSIYMGNTAKSKFISGTDWISINNMEKVFSGTLVLNNNTKWLEIVFDEPFFYAGSNLAVAIVNNHGNYVSGSDPTFIVTEMATAKTLYYQSDYALVNPAAPQSGTVNSFRSNAKFKICEGTGGMPDCTPITNLDLSFNYCNALLTWDPQGENSVSAAVTTLAPNNGYGGIAFDFTAEAQDVTLTGFDLSFRNTGSTDVHFYYRTGTVCGNVLSAEGWEFVGQQNVTVSAAGNDNFTFVPVPGMLTIPAGETYGIYIATFGEDNGAPGRINYRDGTGDCGSSINVSNDDFTIKGGHGISAPKVPFGGTVFSERHFAGTIYYTKSVSDAIYKVYRNGVCIAAVKVPLYFDTDFTPNVNNKWGVTVVCEGGVETAPAEVQGSCCSKVTNAFASILGNCAQATITWAPVNNAFGYKISRNGDFIATVTGSSYTDFYYFVADESYTWSIVTLCQFGESDEVTVSAEADCFAPQCNPVTNLAVSYNYDCDATLTWNAPAKCENVYYSDNNFVEMPENFENINYERKTDDAHTLISISASNSSGTAPFANRDEKVEFTELPLLSRGNIAYAHSWDGYPNGYISFDVADPNNVTSIAGHLNLIGGDCFDGVLYAYNQFGNFLKINSLTGVVDETITGVWHTYISALAYDYTSDIMYGVRDNVLYTINLITGVPTFAANITGITGNNTFILTLAIDLQGNMYGIASNYDNAANLYSINKTTGVATVVGPTGMPCWYAQSMNFDHNDGTLYWYQYSGVSIRGNFTTVNKLTGEATLIAETGREVTNFHIPYTHNPNRPKAPNPFTVTPVGTSLQAELAWTNPTQTAGGDALSGLTKIVIQRNGATVHEITSGVAVGAAMTWTDNTIQKAGIYNYSVYAVNSYGNGLKAHADAIIGEMCPIKIELWGIYSDSWYYNSPTAGGVEVFVDGVSYGRYLGLGLTGSNGNYVKEYEPMLPPGNIEVKFVAGGVNIERWVLIYNSVGDRVGGCTSVGCVDSWNEGYSVVQFQNYCDGNTHYNVYRNGVLIATVSEETFTLEGSPGNHTWVVKAVCTVGESVPTEVQGSCELPIFVTDIINIPTVTMPGIPLTLTGTVIPTNATYQDIEWSVASQGTTGATFIGNTLHCVSTGIALVIAEIENGTAMGVPFIKPVYIYVNDGFVPVTDIINVPDLATARVPLLLIGTAVPANATNQTIIWSLNDAGTTGASVVKEGNVYYLHTASQGIAKVLARITDGISTGQPFDKIFTIDVGPNGIGELQITNYKLRVYPNPTTGELRITGIRHCGLDPQSPANNDEIAGQARNDIQGVQIFDVAGRNVFSTKARKHEGTNGNDEIVLDISELPSGVYFLRVGKEMVKVVKK